MHPWMPKALFIHGKNLQELKELSFLWTDTHEACHLGTLQLGSMHKKSTKNES